METIKTNYDNKTPQNISDSFTTTIKDPYRKTNIR